MGDPWCDSWRVFRAYGTQNFLYEDFIKLEKLSGQLIFLKQEGCVHCQRIKLSSVSQFRAMDSRINRSEGDLGRGGFFLNNAKNDSKEIELRMLLQIRNGLQADINNFREIVIWIVQY